MNQQGNVGTMPDVTGKTRLITASVLSICHNAVASVFGDGAGSSVFYG